MLGFSLPEREMNEWISFLMNAPLYVDILDTIEFLQNGNKELYSKKN